MRRPLHTLAIAALTLGMLGGDIASLSFAPAAAEAHRRPGGFGYGYGYYGRYGHVGYYRNRVSVGEIVATAAVIAGVAAVASSVRNDRRDDDGWGDRDSRRSDRRDLREDIAVDECRHEAERQARTYGTSASLKDIYDVDSRGRDVRVKGLVEIATTATVGGASERRLNTERFTCVVRNGLVDSYQLGGDFAAR